MSSATLRAEIVKAIMNAPWVSGSEAQAGVDADAVLAVLQGAYAWVSDCPICPMLATDRDDALGEVRALSERVEVLEDERVKLLEMVDRLTAEADDNRGELEVLRWRLRVMTGSGS